MTCYIKYLNIPTACYLFSLTECGKIKSTSLVVGLALASFIDGRTMSTTIDKKRLAKRAGVSTETLRKQLLSLENSGFLIITKRIGKSHKYTITLPKYKVRAKNNPTQNLVESLHKSNPLTIQENTQKKERRAKIY